MRVDLEKILENAFILDLDFERGKKYGRRDTRKELDESLERYFNIFGKDPDKLIQTLDREIAREVKRRTIKVFKETDLTEEDKKYFKPLTKEDLNEINGNTSNNLRNDESPTQFVEGFIHGNEPSKESTEGAS